eukprot:GAHX01002216.1.p1 GENE.GAHX01002216.1~~GAHX01002216.1.p1  ORF type:complete len:548 (+),score=129.50 GAHX01002216.1:86-1729(+)
MEPEDSTDSICSSNEETVRTLKLKNKSLKKKLKRANLDLISERGQIRVVLRIKPLPIGVTPTIEKLEPTSLKYNNETDFYFDRIFHNETNHDIYKFLRPFLSSFLDGNNICMFAYGQTGAGKTYTIEGNSKQKFDLNTLYDPVQIKENKDSGVVHKMVNKLLNEKQSEQSFYLSVLEIYNESLIDILNIDAKLPLKINDFKTSNGKNNLVYNLTEKEFFEYKDFARLYELATLNRKTAKTNMNESSSRSHLIYIIKKYGANPSYMLLIDLADSERTNKANTKDQNFKETTNINSSLSYLGNVFSAINSGSKHIPYRNSKLTTILKSCLDTSNKINRNRVIVLCHCSAEKSEMNETKGTLEFASKAVRVDLGKLNKNQKKENDVKKKEESQNDRSTKSKLTVLLKEKDQEISQLKAKTRRLEKELLEAKKNSNKDNKSSIKNYSNRGIGKNKIKVGMTRSTALAMKSRIAQKKKTENKNKFQFSPFKSSKTLPIFKSPKMKNNNILYGDFKNNLGDVKKNLFDDASNEKEKEPKKVKRVTFKEPETNE